MIELLEDYIRNNWHNFNLPILLSTRLSYLFLKGFRKTIFFVFKDDDSQPFAILKISNDPIAFDRLLREYETLSYLSAKEYIKGSIPIPLAFFEMRGHKCLLESALEGTPLVYSMKGIRTRGGLVKMKVIFRMVIETLVSFAHSQERSETDQKKQNQNKNFFACSVVEHGDFNPSNLFVSGNDIKIFDWEYSKIRGKPLNDLLDFSLNYVLFARYLANEIYRELPVLNDFEEAFLSDNSYSKIVWENISIYSDKMGINKSSIRDIFSIFSKKYLNEPDVRSFCRNLDAVM